MTKAQAELIIGSSLSDTAKMPCYSFNLSALHCKTGSKLANIKGSVCYGCYAMKGFYVMYDHINKMVPKTEKIDHPLWVPSMVYLINHQGNKKDSNYFRWHDSGDIQSLQHLDRICQVARRTPNVRHWIPTREYAIVKQYKQSHEIYGIKIPENLVIRLSAHMVDGDPPTGYGLPTSTVTRNGSRTCPAPDQGNKCLDCRACWDPKVSNVAYGYH